MSQTNNADTDSRFAYLEIDDDDRPVTLSPAAPKAAPAPTPAPAAPAAPTARQERLRTYLASRRATTTSEIAAAYRHLVEVTRTRSTPERLETIADLELLISTGIDRDIDRALAALREREAREATQAATPVPSMSISAPIPAPAPAAPIESQPLAIAVQAATETLRAPAVSARRGEISAAPSAARPMPRYVAPTPAPQNSIEQSSKLVVVDEESAQDAGRLVFYTGHPISAAKLAAAWEAERVADYVSSRPEPADPEVAFSRAVKSLQGKGILVRSVPGQHEFVIVEERDTTTAARKTYTTVCRFWQNGNGLCVEQVDGTAYQTQLYRSHVETEFAAARDTIDTVDVTSWLVRTVKRLGGWHVRESGGVYYTPKRRNAAIEAIKRALQACGVDVSAIPVMPGTDAIRVAINGLAAVTTKRLGELRDECAAEERSGKIVARRLDEINEIEKLVTSNENLLGLKLDGVRAEIEQVRTLWKNHTSRGAMLDVG